MRHLAFLLIVSFIATSALSAAAEPPQFAEPADPLTVELLTMGPGEHPFFKFGHNAIRIRDARKGSDTVYNYGTFSFDSPTLLQDFFKGRLQYWLSRESMATTLAHYAGEDRSLLTQRLSLSAAQKLELKRQLDRNARPENRTYKYDYFFDNCSTRLRDALERVTDKQLHDALKAPATQSLRDHALRVTANYFLEYLVLSIGLGPLVDKPTDRWTETFLPEMLTEGIRHTQLRAEDGSQRPFVLEEETLLEHHDDRLKKPPRWTLRFSAAGTFVGLCLAGLAQLSRRTRVASISLGVVLSLGGLVVGLLGLGLVALWTMTDHAVAYRNQNVLLLSPLAIALPWYGVRIALRGFQAIPRLRTLALLLASSALAALAWKLTPLEVQDNRALIAFFLPCWAGLLFSSLLATRTAAELGLQSPLAANSRGICNVVAPPETER
jgi:hypothetical protein